MTTQILQFVELSDEDRKDAGRLGKIGKGDKTPAVLKNTALPSGAPEHLEKLYQLRMKQPT